MAASATVAARVYEGHYAAGTAEYSYDEGSGTLTVTDGTGALALLLALLGS